MSFMSEYLDAVIHLDGALGVALFDLQRQSVIGSAGDIPIEKCGEGMMLMVQAKASIQKELGSNDEMLDGLFTMDSTVQVIKPVYNKGIVIFAVFDKSEANLAMIRLGLQRIADSL